MNEISDSEVDRYWANREMEMNPEVIAKILYPGRINPSPDLNEGVNQKKKYKRQSKDWSKNGQGERNL